MSSLPIEAQVQLQARGKDPAPPTEPGILEALGFASDRADRAQHVLTEILAPALRRLEQRLEPLLKLAPPIDPGGTAEAARASGPAGEISSAVAHRVTELGHRADAFADRVTAIATQVDQLADRVDLS